MDIEDKKPLKAGDIVVVNRYLVDSQDSFPPFSPLLLISTDSSSYLLSPLEKPELTFTIPIFSPLEKLEEIERQMKKQEKLWIIHNILFTALFFILSSSIIWNISEGIKKYAMSTIQSKTTSFYIIIGISIILFFGVIGTELFLIYSPSEIKEFKEEKERWIKHGEGKSQKIRKE